jgi:hypothetical protein
MAGAGGASRGPGGRALSLTAVSCGWNLALKTLEEFGIAPRLSTVCAPVFDAALTSDANQPLAGFRVREHRSLAERNCGAGGRRGRKRRTRKSDEQEVSRGEDRGDPGQTSKRHQTRRKTSGATREPKSRMTLEVQIPQRIWMRGRSPGQPERRPLAMGAMVPPPQAGEVSAKLTEGARGRPGSGARRPTPPPSRRVPRRSTSPVVCATVEELGLSNSPQIQPRLARVSPGCS